MKKLIILFLMMVPLIILSQGQQPLPSNVGLKPIQNNYIPSGNRSIPPGILVWSQLPVCESPYVVACQLDQVGGYDFQVADDFLFTSSVGEISAVRWWIAWFNPPQYFAPTSFNIYIYNNAGCLPGNLVAQWNIPFADTNEDVTCITGWPGQEYWALLNPTFQPVVNQHYWIVTQPVMVFPPQTGIPISAAQNLCPAVQQFFAPFAPLEYDVAFELYASPLVPVSTWALLLGGVLIAAVIFFRYKRSS
jgi:hypothetical protein